MTSLKKSNMHEYQLHGVDWIIEKPKAGLLLDMGLGKTITSLTAISKLIHNLDISNVLVVAPKKVIESVWSQEADKWEHTKNISLTKIIGSEKKRKLALKENTDVHLVSRDNISWLCGLYGGSSLPYDMLIIDELSSFKNSKSLRFKALKQVVGSFSRVVGLTGTPAPNGLVDLWSQIYLLDQGERLEKRLAAYKGLYFKPDKRNANVIFSYKPLENTEKKIYDKIADICMSMKAEDYLQMPDKIIVNQDSNLSKKTIVKYNNFEAEMVLSLFEDELNKTGESIEISPANAAALSNKLLQYSNGAVYDEDRNVHEVHQEKLDSLEELVEAANGKPVLVATAFQHDATRILKRFKKMNPVALKTQDDIDNWNARKISMLILHPASGGHGLNLQEGGNVLIWFGLNWSLELYQQLIARLYRQGQKSKKVFIYHLASPHTIEQKVLASLGNKDQTQKSLMEAVKAIVQKYV